MRETPEMVESFDYLIRTQFSFQSNDQTLSCVLNGLSQQNVNVNAYFHTKEDAQKHLVKIVLGSSKAETPQELQVMRRILRNFRLRFKERQVIQVIKLPAGKSGQLNDLFGALWCDMQIESMYIGEDTNVYVDSSDIERAIEILSSPVMVVCPKDC
jgi:hypothetical protein